MGAISGGRFTAGWWRDSAQTRGVEITGFFLQQRTSTFAAQGSDFPTLGLPFFNVSPPLGEDVFFINGGLGDKGGVKIHNTSRLWGTEVNGLLKWSRNNAWDVNLLAGFRYVDLDEKFGLFGVAQLSSSSIVVADSFATHNQFYGGQVGVRASYRRDRLSADLTGKVALGANRQTVDIAGLSLHDKHLHSQGFYSQSTNIGCRTETVFSVIPEVQVKVGYDLTHRLRATVGYDFLFWSNVVRPGDQIDRNLNISQFENNPLTGTAAPLPRHESSNFFAHGINFGLEFRY